MKANPRIGIVGLGTIGSQELALWQRAGHETVGYDVDPARVRAIRESRPNGTSASTATDDFGDLAGCDVLVLCLPNLGPSGELSMSAFDSFVEGMRQFEPAERLVVVASTVPIGFTKELSRRLGPHGRLLAHVPERFDPGRSKDLGEIPRVAGALSGEALDLTVDLYRRLGVTVHPVEPVGVAEASKLLENSFRLVNIAFINEFAELCRRVGITAADVIDAAATKPFAFMAHQPGVGAGGTCIPTMPQYLLQAAEQSGLKMPILHDAVEGNDKTSERVAEHLRNLLKAKGVGRARVLVVGGTYKPNYPDARASAALRFARGLAAHHDVTVFDPIIDATAFPKDLKLLRELPDGAEFDAVVIAVKHRSTDLEALRGLSPILIDLVRGSVDVAEVSPTRQAARPMGIWIVNHYADPPDGMATRSVDLARRFVERGNKTTVFASNFNHYRFAPVVKMGFRLWKAQDVDGVRFVWIRTLRYRVNNWRRAANMASFTALVLLAGLFQRPRPDVVIGVSVHPLAAWAGYVLSRLKRARFFFEVTDLWPQTLIDLGRIKANSLLARVLRRLELFLSRKAERIVMLLPHTQRYMTSIGVSLDKIVWIPNGVELSRYDDVVPYDGAARPPFRVMFMGGFVESNAIDNILAAARVLKERGRKDIEFMLVGRGTDREAVIKQAREQGLDNVQFPNPVPKFEIGRIMSQADAFIYALHDLPLYQYGVSLNKLTDYLAGGRPIIFSGRSAYDPVADIGAGYSLPPDDPVAIADAIEKLFSLPPAERITMGRKGREYVIEHHDIPKLASQLLEALEPVR
ncbi:MAG TPA: nucleotide sugar dehydrogenase [Candidatus Dormibacteraeota bacterium]|nr:nucleotide sugar dehydrogenase [Candidatus Dormibacteraeota bacterium]